MRLLPLIIAMGAVQAPSPAEITLRGETIAQQIQSRLSDAQLELHADRIGQDGKRIGACFIQLSHRLGSRRFVFGVPDRVVDLGYAGKVIYRISDIRLKAITVEALGGEFVFKSSFVSRGVALKGEHSWLGDAAVPDVKLDHMRLVVRVHPKVTEGGEMTYENPRVEFTADVDNTFIPRFTLLGQTVDVVDALTGYRAELCRSIASQIQLALNDRESKSALSARMQLAIQTLIGGKGSPVTPLRFEGTDLVMALRR